MRREKFVYMIIIIIILVGVSFMIKSTLDVRQKVLDYEVMTEYIGTVDSINAEQASVYYIMDEDKPTFGRTGREMLEYVQVGDSIIKKSGSTHVEVVRYDASEKEVFRKSFELERGF